MIFNISNSGNAGNLVHLRISYDPSLAGATITATNGSEVHTAIANESGLTIISGSKLGEWTVSESMFDTSAVINTVYYGNYNAGLGGGVKITVSFESAFVGKTLTLTNGSKIYSRVATGSEVLFVVADYGTWTVSGEVAGQTYSDSVNVTKDGEYTIHLATAVTLSIDVYSAANDAVYYYPNNDTSKSPITLCTTDINGKASNVPLSVAPNTEIIFYSSVAKDTTEGTSAYSKGIVLSESTTEIKVMPDGALYWYGNKLITFNSYLVIRSNYTNDGHASWQTNSVLCTKRSAGHLMSSGSDNRVDTTGYNLIKAMNGDDNTIHSATPIQNGYVGLWTLTSSASGATGGVGMTNVLPYDGLHLTIFSHTNGRVNVSAIWLE